MNVNIHCNVPQGYYGKLSSAWLKNDKNLKEIYPISEQDRSSIQEQYTFFDTSKREWLYNILTSHYEGMELNNIVKTNIEKIKQDNTFTVTTGQQIHISLGPAFYIYKIASVIRQAKRLQAQFPENNYVPVFWMATEDHDVAEINSLIVFGKTYTWETKQRVPTGRLSPEGLDAICDILIDLGEKENISAEIKDIFKLFKEAYTCFSTLSMATRFIINALFGKYGVIVIDADNDTLKKELQSLIHEDLFSDTVYDSLQAASASLKAIGYGNQVNPRKTHFFIFKNGERLRIDKEGDNFILHPSGELISRNHMMQLATEKPYLFSPNVLLRPLYQQLILPNLAYVCGPAEIHYWHQLFLLFKRKSVVAPMLFLRDSFLVLDSNTKQFLNKYKLSENTVWQGLGVSSGFLAKELIGENKISREIDELKNQTDVVFQNLFDLKYQKIKELRSKSEVWIKELQKAEKSVLQDPRMQPVYEPVFNRLQKITTSFFNKNKPQERSVSWAELLLSTGHNPIDSLIEIQAGEHVFGTICV